MYLEFKKYIHPLFAITFALVVITSPELYAYSFILQTDWSNAIFFFIGVLYFYKHIKSQEVSDLCISILGMFFACWSRTETIFFLPMGSALLLWSSYFKEKVFDKKMLYKPFLFTGIPTVAIVLWNFIYVKLFLPRIDSLLDQMDLSVSSFFSSMGDTIESMNRIVVFNDTYWGYIVSIFLFVLLSSIPIAFRNKKYSGKTILFWLFGLYLVFVFLITQFPAVTVQNTFRRGFFKFIPLMALFMVMSPLLQWINSFIVDKPKDI